MDQNNHFGQYPGTEPQRRQDVTTSAGAGVDSRLSKVGLADYITSSVRNYTQRPILISEGVIFDQSATIKRIHQYLNSTFESGDQDENGDDRYFHNIITPRNVHATKNIDVDTKDMLVTSDTKDGWWFSFFLRNRLQLWMRDTGMNSLLNDLVTNLPNFGKVIWKKMGSGDNLRIREVDLRNISFDPSVKTIKDSGLFVERMIMEPWKIMAKCRPEDSEEMGEYDDSSSDPDGYWDRKECIEAVRMGLTKRDKFISSSGAPSTSQTQYSLTDTLPLVDVWECYGWFPEAALDLLNGEENKETLNNDDKNEIADVTYHYCKVIVSGLDGGTMRVLFWTKMDEEDFPYMDCDFFRRVPGRCLPISNSEALLNLQVRMNELINRFFQALRFGSLALFQTETNSAYSNLLSDAQNGDMIVSKKAINRIDTEVQAFQQYQEEVQNIERQADLLCNTFDIVTGDSLPTNTPFRLGSQQRDSAGKVFEQTREDIGIFLTNVFWEWILPEVIEDFSMEHMLEVTGSVDELKMFDEQYRKYLSAQSVKDYVLKNNRLPTKPEMDALQNVLAAESSGKTRKVKIDKNYFTMERIRSLRIFFDVTDERKNFAAQMESRTSLLQVIAANPAVLQNEDTRTLIGQIMEAQGMSPTALSAFTSKPQPAVTPQAAASQATSPASQAPASPEANAAAPEPVPA